MTAMQSPEADARKAAAKAAATIAANELPTGAWPAFLPIMLKFVTAEAHSEATKVAALSSLGYTCELNDKIEQDGTNDMLNIIVSHGMKKRSENVRLVATITLAFLLPFNASQYGDQKGL